jgi:hypothetical protein
LLVLEKRILRSVYGAVQTEEEWRIRNNDELNKLMRGEDMVKYMSTKDKMVGKS